MIEFKEITHEHLDKHPGLAGVFINPIEPEEQRWHFIIEQNHLLWIESGYMPAFNEMGSYQIEFPKKALRWFLTQLEEQFFKTEAEGGLPKGVFNISGEVDGERIKLARAFNADFKGSGGYAFIALDRKDGRSVKDYTITDAMLFQHGMIDVMKEIADKIDAAEL